MQEQGTPETILCSRCGRAPREDEPIEVAEIGLPRGWEGTRFEGVCPGCQLAEWHSLCRSLLDADGERVAAVTAEDELILEPAIAGMPRAEIASSDWMWCDYKDSSVSWIDGESEPPAGCRCPSCGGTNFMWVRADYPTSGLASPVVHRRERRA
jgi:hypothetical protein